MNLIEVVYGDTDSLYLSYEGILNTIEGIEDWTIEQKTKFIVDFNKEFLDEHNRVFMEEYYKSRHADSIQNFELETVSLSGCWLDVKKRYAQILLWKDGKTFDLDNLPLKAKGLEIVKSSYPKQARESLTRLVRVLLEDQGGDMLLQRLNMEMQKEKIKFYNAPLEEICGAVSVQNYTKYILDDTDPISLKVAPKCPSNVRALGTYNRLRNVHKLPGDPIYGGKVKWYKFLPVGATKKTPPEFFAFVAGDYPEWADKYAPINKDLMFQQFVLDPFNRILSAMQLGELRIDGSIQCNLSLF